MKPVIAVVAATFCAVVLDAGAQTYPARLIRLVVPWPAGGPPDAIGRLLGQRVGEALKQQIVVDNRAGANSIIGTEIVAKRAADDGAVPAALAVGATVERTSALNSNGVPMRTSAVASPNNGVPAPRFGAPPDGYTYLLTTGSHTTNAALHAKLPYDTLNDFVSLTLVVETAGMVLGVHPSVPTTNVKEFVALAKSKPGQLTFGSAGNGNTLHLAGELFKVATGTNLTHVPYKGAAPALNDLLGGHIDMMFASPVSMAPPIHAGRLRGLAQMGAKRSPLLPELETLDELGYRNAQINGWYGLYAPAKTPKQYIDRFVGEVWHALKDPVMIERLRGLGAEPIGMPQEEFARYVVTDIDKYAKLGKRINLKLE